jgi:hypothetical protein
VACSSRARQCAGSQGTSVRSSCRRIVWPESRPTMSCGRATSKTVVSRMSTTALMPRLRSAAAGARPRYTGDVDPRLGPAAPALVIKVALNACDVSRGHVYRVPQGDPLGPPWTRRLRRRTRWPAGWHSAPSARSGLTSTRSAGLSWSSKRLAAGRPCTRRRRNFSSPTHPPESIYARANLVCRTRVSFRQGSSCSRGCISP